MGGEKFFAVVENDLNIWKATSSFGGQKHSKRQVCTVTDTHDDGRYDISGTILEQGIYQLKIYHAFPNGLLGTYFWDSFMENIALTRIDRIVNFTWGSGRLLPRASDYVSIRWTGVLQSDLSDIYEFRVF